MIPNVNTLRANGMVSSRGALDEMFPSLLSPFLRLKKEPVASPIREVKPRKLPSIIAVR